MYRHLAPSEFLFLIFHHSTNPIFLSTGIISQRHNNTNEDMKQAPKRHVLLFGPREFLFLNFHHSPLILSIYLRVLSHNDTITPTRVRNRRPNDDTCHFGPGKFLFFFLFLFFMIQLTFTFLFTGLVLHRHDNTNERTKPEWKDDDIKATAVLSEVDG